MTTPVFFPCHVLQGVVGYQKKKICTAVILGSLSSKQNRFKSVASPVRILVQQMNLHLSFLYTVSLTLLPTC